MEKINRKQKSKTTSTPSEKNKDKAIGKFRGGKMQQLPSDMWKVISEKIETTEEFLNLSSASVGLRKTLHPNIEPSALTIDELLNQDYHKVEYAKEHNLLLSLDIKNILAFPNGKEVFKEFIENSPYAKYISNIKIGDVENSNRGEILEIVKFLDIQRNRIPHCESIEVSVLNMKLPIKSLQSLLQEPPSAD